MNSLEGVFKLGALFWASFDNIGVVIAKGQED